MPSAEFENIKKEHPRLSSLLDGLATYIAQQLGRGREEIVPSLAAASLQISEAEALGLLMLMDRAGLLTPIYNVYCKANGTFLVSVEKKEELPEAIYCRYCDREHCDAEELEIELAFRVKEHAREAMHPNVPVS
jgi:hypothetical protein